MPTPRPTLPPEVLRWLQNQPMAVLRIVSRELGRIGQERVEAVPGLRRRGGAVREQLDVLNPNERGLDPSVVPNGRRADDWIPAITPEMRQLALDHCGEAGVLTEHVVERLMEHYPYPLEVARQVVAHLVAEGKLVEREWMLYRAVPMPELTALDHILAD